MDADRRRKPGCLLDDGTLAEGLGVELGRLGGGSVAPDGGDDELIHADIVFGGAAHRRDACFGGGHCRLHWLVDSIGLVVTS